MLTATGGYQCAVSCCWVVGCWAVWFSAYAAVNEICLHSAHLLCWYTDSSCDLHHPSAVSHVHTVAGATSLVPRLLPGFLRQKAGEEPGNKHYNYSPMQAASVPLATDHFHQNSCFEIFFPPNNIAFLALLAYPKNMNVCPLHSSSSEFTTDMRSGGLLCTETPSDVALFP